MNHSLNLVGMDSVITTKTPRRSRRLTQRGMATAEYAVGILAAVTLALVLFKVFQDAKFFKAFLGLVLKAVSFVTGMIK